MTDTGRRPSSPVLHEIKTYQIQQQRAEKDMSRLGIIVDVDFAKLEEAFFGHASDYFTLDSYTGPIPSLTIIDEIGWWKGPIPEQSIPNEPDWKQTKFVSGPETSPSQAKRAKLRAKRKRRKHHG